MRALVLLAFVPAFALAQPTPSSAKAPAAATGSRAGIVSLTAQTLGAGVKTFSSSLQSVNGYGNTGSGATQGMSFSGGSTILRGDTVYLQASSGNSTFAQMSSSGNVFTSQVANGGTAVGHDFDTGVSLSTAGALLGRFKNAGTLKASISKDGDYVTTGFVSTGDNGYGRAGGNGVTQGFAFNGNDTYMYAAATGNAIFLRDTSNVFMKGTASGVFQGSALNPIPIVHAAVTGSPVAIEYGSGSANGSGVLAVTFSTAFGLAPSCVCADTNAAPVSCGISTAASTTTVTFTIGSARADTVQWHCIGNK